MTDTHIRTVTVSRSTIVATAVTALVAGGALGTLVPGPGPIPGAPDSVPYVHNACLVALDRADEVNGVQLTLANAAVDMFQRLAKDPLSVKAYDDYTKALSTATKDIEAIDYLTPAAQCREAAL